MTPDSDSSSLVKARAFVADDTELWLKRIYGV